MCLESKLIQYCSPTLASLKSANLFTVVTQDIGYLNKEVKRLNVLLAERGIKITVLLVRDSSVLVYVYRENVLKHQLAAEKVGDFLAEFGYDNVSVDYAIEKLKDRIFSQDNFPHEIGVFLDYPLDDIKAFIDNKGKNFRHCGYWKVYSNFEESLQKFADFDRCKELYKQMWQNGSTIRQLALG